MGTRCIHHRTALDRAGIAHHTGTSPATVTYWYRHRATNRFPEKAFTDPDGRHWWWLDDIDTFHTAYQATKHHAYTQVDRSGNPDDLLTAPQAARVLGYASHRSITDQLRERADEITEFPSGRKRRRWYRATIWDYADHRADHTSPGRPSGISTGRAR